MNNIIFLQQCAMKAVAFVIYQKHYEANGKAIILILSYLDTIENISSDEKRVVAGRAFDIFSAALQNENN